MSLLNFMVVYLAIIVPAIFAFPDYVTYIPNGDRVPHSCDRSTIWPAPGHRNPEGMGRTTPFGSDFGGHWTKQICEQDSDGDGRTNGEELGDPDCIWERGDEPQITDPDQLSHPGVCEPLDSPICKDKNLFLPKDCLDRFPTKAEADNNNNEL